MMWQRISSGVLVITQVNLRYYNLRHHTHRYAYMHGSMQSPSQRIKVEIDFLEIHI